MRGDKHSMTKIRSNVGSIRDFCINVKPNIFWKHNNATKVTYHKISYFRFKLDRKSTYRLVPDIQTWPLQ